MKDNLSKSILVFTNNGSTIYVDPNLKPSPDSQVIVQNEYGVNIENYNNQSPLVIVGVVVPKPEQ